MAKQFSKVPIQMRQWVRHVIDIPDDCGTVTFLDPQDDILPVILHETGHSLELSGAYLDSLMSSSGRWWSSYDQDSNVPDIYAQTNASEDVAQNTVIAVFNENLPSQYESVELNWNNHFHQYATLISKAIDASQGNNLFKTRQNAQCTHRMPPSAAVPVDGGSKKGEMLRRGEAH